MMHEIAGSPPGQMELIKTIFATLRRFNSAITSQSLDRAYRFMNAGVIDMQPKNKETAISIGDVVAIVYEVSLSLLPH